MVRHIGGIAITTAMVAFVLFQAAIRSFPIPGGDAARQGSARKEEAVASRIADLLLLPAEWMHAPGEIIWVLAPVPWGVVAYGTLLLLWRGLEDRRMRSRL